MCTRSQRNHRSQVDLQKKDANLMRLRVAATTVFRARVSGSCAGAPPPPMTCGGGAAAATHQAQQSVRRQTGVAELDSHVKEYRHLASVHDRNVRMECSPGAATSQASPGDGRPLPVDHASSPFHELDLEELWKGIGRTRVRQHVNPLRAEYMIPTGPVDWHAAFANPTLPLVLDLGCGSGRFLLLLNKRRRDAHAAAGAAGAPACNFLGIEIRKPLVDRANEWATRLGYDDNVHFIYSNATIHLESIMSTYPGRVESVYIQFPDPHFKKRHRKRRIFQPNLVRAIRDMLPPGGTLFLQSDVDFVSCAMRNCFEYYVADSFQLAPQHAGSDAVFFSRTTDPRATPSEAGGPASASDVPLLVSTDAPSSDDEDPGAVAGEQASGTGHEAPGSAEHDAGGGGDDGDYDSLDSKWALGGWLKENPVGVPTEREYACGIKGMPVYRMLLVRS